MYYKKKINEYKHYEIDIYILKDEWKGKPIYSEYGSKNNDCELLIERNYSQMNDDFCQFLSRRDEAQTKTIKLKTGFTLYNEENKNIPLIIDDINKKFNQFVDKNGKDSYFMMIKNGDEIEIKNFENDYKIKNDDKHQNVYFIKDNKEIPIYSDYKDNIVGTDICSREVNKELFTENLFNFLKSEENKSGLIKFDC